MSSGGNSPGVIFRGVIVLRGVVFRGVIFWGVIAQGVIVLIRFYSMPNLPSEHMALSLQAHVMPLYVHTETKSKYRMDQLLTKYPIEPDVKNIFSHPNIYMPR